MLNCKLCTTEAMKGNPGRIPTIPKSNDDWFHNVTELFLFCSVLENYESIHWQHLCYVLFKGRLLTYPVGPWIVILPGLPLALVDW